MRKKDVKEAINSLVNQHNRFPKISELAAALGISNNQAQQCMKALVDDGFLIRQGNWYRIAPVAVPVPSQHLTSPHTVSGRVGNDGREALRAAVKKELLEQVHEITEEEFEMYTETEGFEDIPESIPAILAELSPEEPLPQVPVPVMSSDLTVLGIQIAMGIIGGGAAIISMYYTAVWLFEFLPVFFALILSGIMVGFSILAFEVVILFLSGRFKHWTRWVIAGSFIILWLLVSAFSITSTVAGQYNEHMKNTVSQTQQQQSNTPGRVEWAGIQDRKEELQLRMKEKREQLASLQQLYSSMGSLEARTKNGKTWQDTSWKMTQAEKSLDVLSKEQEQLRQSEKELVVKYPGIIGNDGQVKNIPDFYGWAAGVLKKERDIVQFLLSLIPAVFVDIIAPFSIAIAIFLKRRGPAEK